MSVTPAFIGAAVKIGKGTILRAVLTLAIPGSIFAVNMVSNRDHAGIVTGTRAALVVSNTGSTLGTGALVSNSYLPTPFDYRAPLRGYRTGSGVGTYFQLDIVANPTGANFDCHRTTGRNAGTGSTTSVFTNVSATGSINVSQTALTLGPTQGIGCYTTDRIKSTTQLRLRAIFSDSDVTN